MSTAPSRSHHKVAKMSADPQQDSKSEAHSDEIKRALIKLKSDCEECSLLRGGIHERLKYLRLYYRDADEVDELLKADSLCAARN